MNNIIPLNDLANNTFFWFTYLSWFRGYDEVNEINIDEALEVIGIDPKELSAWENDFFSRSEGDKHTKYISGKLDEKISFLIEFQESEIVFFLNGIYIGNLGGHFEAWFFTWQELLAFQKFDQLFLLLLPLTGVEEHQIQEASKVINNHLKSIPKFEIKAEYIANCVLNGLKIEGKFSEQNGVGIVNNQNHSIRNIENYPIYTEEVIKLNKILKHLVEKT